MLRLIKEGKPAKEIASLLSISINTVKIHKRHIMEKLDVHSIIELIHKLSFTEPYLILKDYSI
ncbi:MAG: helix-turn-helix transcriptional regulator [Candidatus Latescibacter sp.]|nr:helix-turn-helix transcriptional regulator [Candidatus Latescibacter sp.]